MNYEQLIFFDLETSGLIPSEHDIIQIAAVDAVSGDTFERLVRFKLSNASQKALEINHYNPDLWAEKAVSQRTAFLDFKLFVQEHAKQKRISKKTGEEYCVAVMAGHNIDKFDMEFLKDWEKRFGDRLTIDYACYDTLQLARWLLPDKEKGYNLQDLADFFHLNTDNLHNAIDDVYLNMKIAGKLIELLQPEKMPCWIKKCKKL